MEFKCVVRSEPSVLQLYMLSQFIQNSLQNTVCNKKCLKFHHVRKSLLFKKNRFRIRIEWIHWQLLLFNMSDIFLVIFKALWWPCLWEQNTSCINNNDTRLDFLDIIIWLTSWFIWRENHQIQATRQVWIYACLPYIKDV